ncbi:FAD-dependent oxidoreductase [Aureimonas fodinaquatilis]|uniref:FAD-dependent oxidoreductase n=1 Tax=Aureimonas fodinaquatilis TaxID=2565783 RepID=A0A5B0DQE8_9HYPH|nr:FAD-dependent oxidoreductase [Aureimonas fodinaquatilis]KAA0968653.1 FAD-dependent oxidoreductase [Aureimonas fodinaquatilis]
MVLRELDADCAIVGGGPAGMMLAVLLAKSGIDVVLMEKHADFLRDFRGDTIHPSTLEVMREIGLLEQLLALPHTRANSLQAEIGGAQVTIADFSRLPVGCRYIAFMPQWDFLNLLAQEAKAAGLRLEMPAKVTGLIEADGRVCGVNAETADGELAVRAGLVVVAEGRKSGLREAAGLEVDNFGLPGEVLWFRLSHQPDDPPYTMSHAGPQQGLVMIDRGAFWQCGYILRSESHAAIQQKGIDAFRAMVAPALPLPASRLDEVTSFDDVQLLTIRIDRLRRWWKPGLLCIGDAAHAMSPIGGVGVNLAIQDAVAAANILTGPLRKGGVSDAHLAAVQKRREWPARLTQKLQVMMQKGAKKRREAGSTAGPPGIMRKIARWPVLAHLTGRLIGLGIRPEHVKRQKY